MSANDPASARRRPRNEVTVNFEIQAPAPGEEELLERAQAEAIFEVLEYLRREQPEQGEEGGVRSEDG
jgi:hypothetical protein